MAEARGTTATVTITESRPRSRYKVTGMDCASCAQKIDAAVRRVSGVRDVIVSAATRSLIVDHEPSLASAAVERQVKGLGCGIARVDGADGEHARDGDHLRDDRYERPWWLGRKAILTIACGIALVVAYAVGRIAPETELWAFLLAMSVGRIPIARRAMAAAFSGSPFTIETLMTVAAVGAVTIGETEEAAIVVFLFLIGELLEGVAAGRARASIRALTNLVPNREGNAVRMRERHGGLPIPAGGETRLAPGGDHLMFSGLEALFEVGTPVNVTLVFERAGSVSIALPVEPLGSRHGVGHNGH